MRTNIVLNQKFVKTHKRRDLRDLAGKIQLKEDYDYKAIRQREWSMPGEQAGLHYLKLESWVA